MSLQRIDIVSIPVSDQPRSKAFYTEKLGFEVLRDNPMGPDQQWVQLGIPGADTSITLVHWFPNMPPGCQQGLVIATDDIDVAHAELSGHGVELSPIDAQPWGRFATFSDPDGNGWVLAQAAEGGM